MEVVVRVGMGVVVSLVVRVVAVLRVGMVVRGFMPTK